MSGTTPYRIVLRGELTDRYRTAFEPFALETTLVAHGFPAPAGVEVGLASDAAVRAAWTSSATRIRCSTAGG